MKTRVLWTLAASAMTIAISVQLPAQTRDPQANREGPWNERTPWGDPELQGEWTTEGEYGVPCERPTQYGTRQFLTAAHDALRIAAGPTRQEGDEARVHLLSENHERPHAPIPDWRGSVANPRVIRIVND